MLRVKVKRVLFLTVDREKKNREIKFNKSKKIRDSDSV